MLQLARITLFRNAPDGSWINPVERAMAFFNMPLSGRGFAREPCIDSEIERKVKNLNSMQALRDASKNDDGIRKGWEESIGPSKRELEKLFSRVKVNGRFAVPFELKDVKEDVETLQNLVINNYDYDLTCTEKKHFNSEKYKKFKERVRRGNEEGRTQLERYVTEIDGIMDRVPKRHVPFFRYSIPLPQKVSHKDDKFLSTEEARKRQEKGDILDGRFFPTCISKNAKSACATGMAEDMKIKEAHPKVFLMKSAIGVVTCEECDKKRVVFAVNVPENNEDRDDIMELVKIEMEKKPYVCRYKLITSTTSSIFGKIFAREKVTCGADIQNEYYQHLVPKLFYPTICVECGSTEDLEEHPPQEGHYRTRALCISCLPKLQLAVERGRISRVTYGKKRILPVAEEAPPGNVLEDNSATAAPPAAIPTAATAAATAAPIESSSEESYESDESEDSISEVGEDDDDSTSNSDTLNIITIPESDIPESIREADIDSIPERDIPESVREADTETDDEVLVDDNFSTACTSSRNKKRRR